MEHSNILHILWRDIYSRISSDDLLGLSDTRKLYKSLSKKELWGKAIEIVEKYFHGMDIVDALALNMLVSLLLNIGYYEQRSGSLSSREMDFLKHAARRTLRIANTLLEMMFDVYLSARIEEQDMDNIPGFV